MAQADGSVNIKVNLDTSKTDKDLAKLKKEIAKLEESASAQEAKKNPLIEQANQLRYEIKEAQKEADKFGQDWVNGIVGADREQSAALEKVSQLEAEYQAVLSQINKIDEKLLATYTSIDRNKEAAGNLARELAGASGTANVTGQTGTTGTINTAAAEQAATRMESILSRMKSLILEAGSSFRIGLSGIADGFRNLGSRIASAMKSGLSSISKFTKSGLQKLITYAGRATKSMLPLVNNSRRMGNTFASNLKTILLYSIGLRGLYSLFRKARSAMVEGFKNLAQYSDTTNASISMLTSALTQLKNSLATAFAPILNVVAPIITKFINMLSAAANAVARLMAMLTGQSTYVKAIAVQEDYADSLEGTAGAAEDAAGSLASFDEINTITTENASGGGGGGTTADEMFETVAVEPFSFDSWGEAFSAFLDTIIEEGIPRLKAALTSLANWINTFSANLYEMFTFPGVYDKVVIIGEEVARALNDFVNQIDWATLGGALGAGLNLALALLVSFVYTFDWLNLGASLATMINNAIAEIDWYNVGMLLWAKFKIAIETLAGFLSNLDVVQLAQAASNIVIGFFNSMTETIQNIDWNRIGEQIGTFLISIDWTGIILSVGSAIAAAIPSLLDFVFGFAQAILPGKLGEIVGLVRDDLIGGIEELLGGFIDFLSSVFSGDLDGAVAALGIIFEGLGTAVDAVINGIEALFQSFLDWLDEITGGQLSGIIDFVKGLVSGAFGFISDTFSAISETVSSVLGGIITFITGVFTGDWQSAWEGITSIFTGIWNGIVSVLESAVNLIISGINWLISQLNKVSFSIPDWVPLIGGKSFGFNIPSISEISIPRLAEGAVIPPNREFMAVLGDQTSGTNIETPESLLRQIVREESGSGSNGELASLLESILTVLQEGQVIKVNETVLGRTSAKAINKITQSSGKSVLLY